MGVDTERLLSSVMLMVMFVRLLCVCDVCSVCISYVYSDMCILQVVSDMRVRLRLFGACCSVDICYCGSVVFHVMCVRLTCSVYRCSVDTCRVLLFGCYLSTMFARLM